MKKIFTLFLLLTAFSALQAEVRIGVVDLEKIFREMQTKTTIRYYYSSTRTDKIKD